MQTEKLSRLLDSVLLPSACKGLQFVTLSVSVSPDTQSFVIFHWGCAEALLYANIQRYGVNTGEQVT